MSGDCKGWGIEPFGLGPWGSVDAYPPTIISMDPPCDSTGVPPCTPITIKVGDKGCSGFNLDCVRIYIDGTLIYSGAGLSFSAGTQNNGWLSPCDNGSTVTRASDATYGYIYTFKIVCTCFDCNKFIRVNATFCDLSGNTSTIDCLIKTAICNYLQDVEIIDKRRYLLRFTTPLVGDITRNADLYNPDTYVVSPVDLGYVKGSIPKVEAVLVEKVNFPRTVILELDNTSDGAAYHFQPSKNIINIYGSTYEESGKGIAISRRTKLDFILNRLPRVYNRSIIVNDATQISPYHILSALGIEDERSGGSF